MVRNATGWAQVDSGEKGLSNTSTQLTAPVLIHRGQSQEEVRDRYHQCPAEEEPVQFAITLIQGKWKIGILSRLQQGPARLSQLRRIFPEASKKMLTQHLREMEKDGLIVRTDLSGRLRHVEYSLSEPNGLAVSLLIHVLATWSTAYPALANAPGEGGRS